MQKFGYLERGPPDSEALYTSDAVEAALKKVQRYGALPETGALDEETIKVGEEISHLQLFPVLITIFF